MIKNKLKKTSGFNMDFLITGSLLLMTFLVCQVWEYFDLRKITKANAKLEAQQDAEYVENTTLELIRNVEIGGRILDEFLDVLNTKGLKKVRLIQSKSIEAEYGLEEDELPKNEEEVFSLKDGQARDWETDDYFVFAKPLKAEKMCQPCHHLPDKSREQVPIGYIIGIIEVSIPKTTMKKAQSHLIGHSTRAMGLTVFLVVLFGAGFYRLTLAVRESEQKTSAIIKTLGEGIIVIGPDSIIRSTNQELCNIFGYTEEELVGQNIRILMPGKFRSDHFKGMERYLKEGTSRIVGFRVELEGLKKDGEVFPIKIKIEEVLLKGGKERFFTGAIRDISERKKADADKEKYVAELEQAQKDLKEKQGELIKAARLADCGIIASGIAHDFNNILTQILGETEIAQDEDKLELIRDSLVIVKKQAQKAGDLTHKLLAIGGKAMKLEIGRVDMATVIKGGLGILKGQLISKGIDVEIDIDHGIPVIAGDEGQLQDVIQNLAFNSMHAMEDRIKQEGMENKKTRMKLFISCREKDGALEILVRDTGIGIPKKNLEKIFVPFFTTKAKTNQKGTGLGMAMVLASVQTHGGKIEVESFTPEMIANDTRLGDKTPGTAFRITIPIQAPPGDNNKKGEEKTAILNPEGLIYIVEDEEVIRDVTKRMLSAFGYNNLEFFASGLPALDALKKAIKNGREFPAIILSDIQMPEMDGFSLYKEISKLPWEFKKPAFAVITGKNTSENIEPFRKHGDFFVGSIAKPFLKKELLELINKAMVK